MRVRPQAVVLAAALLLSPVLRAAGASGEGVSRADPGRAQLVTATRILKDAVSGSPGLAAARARVEAARERVGASGRWADPEVEVMAGRGDMVADDMTMWGMNLRQPLPKYGERGADRDRAQAAVAMAEADFARMAGEMAMDVAMAAAEADAATRRIALLEAQIARMETVLASVDARLAAGVGRLADRLTVQTRIASMRLMVEREVRMAGDARSEIQARLGPAAAPLPEFSAPDVAALAPSEAPMVQLADARESEARAMQAMARAGGRPMTGIGLRLEREQTIMGNEDTIGIAFMSDIPWRSRRYARAELRAAHADAVAARAEATTARWRVDAALARAERAADVAAVARRIGAETRARLDAEFESFVRASAADSGMADASTVLMTVEILEKVTETELQVIDAELQDRLAHAALWPHAPAALWSDKLQQP